MNVSLGSQLWREHCALLGRWIARLRREPFALVGTVVQPVIWLLLFGHLLARMAEQAAIPGGDYLRFMTAGAVVMTIFNASIVGGVELLFDREVACWSGCSPRPCTESRLSQADSRTSSG